MNARFSPEQLVVKGDGRIVAARPAAAAGLVGRSSEDVLGMTFAALSLVAKESGMLESSIGRLRLEVLFGGAAEVDSVLVTRERSRTRTELPIPAPSRFVRSAAEVVGQDRATEAAVTHLFRLAETDLPVLIRAERGMAADVLVRELHARSRRKTERLCHLRIEGLTAQRAEDALALALELSGSLFIEGAQRVPPLLLQQFVNRVDHGLGGALRLVIAVDPTDLSGDPLSVELATSVAKHATVSLSPVREREDIAHLIGVMTNRMRRGVTVSREVVERLRRYSLRGNLAELSSCLEYAVTVAAPSRNLESYHLPPSVVDDHDPDHAAPGGTRQAAERDALLVALRDARGNAAAAARKLGVARSTLYRWMRKHGVDW